MKETEQSNLHYDDVTKYLVPLLDNKITIDDLSAKAGYVGAFTGDINRPYHYDNVILLYEPRIDKHTWERIIKFDELTTIKQRYSITLNNKAYNAYVFIKPPDTKKDINLLLTGEYFHISAYSKGKIITFWNDGVFSDTCKKLYFRTNCTKKIESIIPEEDLGYYDSL